MRTTLFAAALTLGLGPIATAGPILRLTREDGANAIRFRGETLTLDDLIALRAEQPGRFDFFHPRLGSALALGKDVLLARRDLAPRRFDHYHPYLGWLLKDPTTDTLPPAPLPPDDTPPGPRPPLPEPPTPTSVPEPATVVLAVLAAVGTIVCRRAPLTAPPSAKGQPTGDPAP